MRTSTVSHSYVTRRDAPAEGIINAVIVHRKKMAASSGDLQQWLVSSVKRMGLTDTDSVSQWLEDLRMLTETECMCVLQGKSLNKESTDLVLTTARSSKDSIDMIRGRAHVISTEFSKLFRKAEKERWKHARSGALRVTCQIRSLLHECNSSLSKPSPEFFEQEQLVMVDCAKLAQYVDSHIGSNGLTPSQVDLMPLLMSLGQSFSRLVDITLGALIENLLGNLSDTESVQTVVTTLGHLVSLGLEGEHMCCLITREGALQVLFDICKKDPLQDAHAQALRAIATVCCVSESIEELEKVGGVECLSDILSMLSISETVRAEAAGVVAQITSPCLEHYQLLSGFIENLEDLVRSLTHLCVESTTHEVFLLGSAALANITFMDSMACDFLQQYHTAEVLIEATALDKAESLFAKDQVVTVLANMAAMESCWPEITENNGVELLVNMLHESARNCSSEAELSACERILQKTAIALTRLSKDLDAAQIVVEMGGLSRLVEVCKEPDERNNSDAVLVACLAALRKICSVCTVNHLEEGSLAKEDLRELTKPKLLESFILCSSLDESVV